MRTWGRVFSEDGSYVWTEVTTDSKGFNDFVYLTTLIQCLQLNLGESPFYGSFGIPAKPSVVQQVPPDFYVAQTQQQFAQYFAYLVITKQGSLPPTYLVTVITHQGVTINASVPVPV